MGMLDYCALKGRILVTTAALVAAGGALSLCGVWKGSSLPSAVTPFAAMQWLQVSGLLEQLRGLLARSDTPAIQGVHVSPSLLMVWGLQALRLAWVQGVSMIGSINIKGIC